MPVLLPYGLERTLTEQLNIILRSLPGLLPELALALAFLLIILLDLVLVGRKAEFRANVLLTFTILAWLVVGAVTLAQWQQPPAALFEGMLTGDRQTVFFQLLFLLTAVATLLHAYLWRTAYQHVLSGEGLALLTGTLLGLFLLIRANHLLMTYLSVELVSLASYALASFSDERKSAEGGLKYLLFGAISSGVMLYGMSWLYGLTGSLAFTDPAFAVQLVHAPSLPLWVATILTLSGLLFKLSAFPFHFWTPDVYEAAPTPIAAFFSVAPKAAALVILMRLLTHVPLVFTPVLAVVAIGSLAIGNLSALWQTNGKRMLAYSSIAHAGFMLVGLVAANRFGWQCLVFYLTTHLFISMAAFYLLDLAARLSTVDPQGAWYALNRLRGLGLRHPGLGIALLAVMVALTGLPPTAGFSAKLFVFSALWEAYHASENPWLLGLFVFGLLNAVVALFYYLKIPFLLFFRSPTELSGREELTGLQKLFMGYLLIPVFLFFLKPDWLMDVIAAALGGDK